MEVGVEGEHYLIHHRHRRRAACLRRSADKELTELKARINSVNSNWTFKAMLMMAEESKREIRFQDRFPMARHYHLMTPITSTNDFNAEMRNGKFPIHIFFAFWLFPSSTIVDCRCEKSAFVLAFTKVTKVVCLNISREFSFCLVLAIFLRG